MNLDAKKTTTTINQQSLKCISSAKQEEKSTKHRKLNLRLMSMNQEIQFELLLILLILLLLILLFDNF